MEFSSTYFSLKEGYFCLKYWEHKNNWASLFGKVRNIWASAWSYWFLKKACTSFTIFWEKFTQIDQYLWFKQTVESDWKENAPSIPAAVWIHFGSGEINFNFPVLKNWLKFCFLCEIPDVNEKFDYLWKGDTRQATVTFTYDFNWLKS